jgi:hypothetical protein
LKHWFSLSHLYYVVAASSDSWQPLQGTVTLGTMTISIKTFGILSHLAKQRRNALLSVTIYHTMQNIIRENVIMVNVVAPAPGKGSNTKIK